ncbi:MAG: 50S ribosomal protein L6 [Parachlamydiales bacterium]|nr:50S ribosomal protein L6 [Parachlamydiales bacterium]
MSKIGNSPIKVPKGVEVKVHSGEVRIKGPKGELTLQVPMGIIITPDGEKVGVGVKEKGSVNGATHGLYRALVNNMILGTSSGFEKTLQLVGVGFRAAMKGKQLELQLGFSHPVLLDVPAGLQVKIDQSTMITISGMDKQLVGQFAAIVRQVRPPEPYKGKGVRYVNEYVRKKAGKAAKGK